MYEIGASSACWYPLETEASLRRLGETGFTCAELFLNAPSELEPPFVRELNRIRAAYGIRIVSLHPFSSFMENTFLFSPYERRFTDTLPFYDRYFEVTAALGGEILVLHGAKAYGGTPEEAVFERFAILAERAKRQGVRLCQENVVDFRSESPDYLLRMAKYVGEDFGVVFDIKQARRTGIADEAFINALAPYIRHVHVSDFDGERDCLPPGEGLFDFSAFFSRMANAGCKVDYIIELYRHSYERDEQLADAAAFLKNRLPFIGSYDKI